MALARMEDVIYVHTPELKHLKHDAILMHFDVDDAEMIREKWVERFVTLLKGDEQKGNVSGLVEKFEKEMKL
jgi:hypothetical protein